MAAVDAASDGEISVTGAGAAALRRAAFSAGVISLVGAGAVKVVKNVSSAGLVTVTDSSRAGKKTNTSSSGQITVTGKGSSGQTVVAFSAGQITVTSSASIDQGRNSLGVCDVVRTIMLLWNFDRPCGAPAYVFREALKVLNTAMQTLWNQAADRDYWTQSTMSITLQPGVDSYDLPNEIQNVVGPGRIESSRKTIVPVGTTGDFEQFQSLFLDGDAPAAPVAYYVQRQNQAERDPVKAVFMVTPAPTVETTFLLEVVNECPRYDINDYTRCPIIPIPHRYVESILLPICRYLSKSFYLFSQAELVPAIDADYALAQQALGLADPLPGKSGDNTNRREDPKT